MKIGDIVYIRGTIDEIRKDVIIIKNKGGYFGTVSEEIQVNIGDYPDIGNFSDKLWLNSRNRAFDEVLEIIDEDIGEHIYRDAFRSREDLKELYDRVRGHIVALKGGEKE